MKRIPLLVMFAKVAGICGAKTAFQTVRRFDHWSARAITAL
jgi:hypothetical protein